MKAVPFSRRTFLASAAASAPDPPPLTFAAPADIQYADRDSAGKRRYRESLPKLQESVSLVREAKPAFTIQLGDIIDEGLSNLDHILPAFARMPAPRYHVIGNHDLTVERSILMGRLKLRRGYYTFKARGWRFFVLDGTDLNAGSPQGREILASLRQQKAPNAQDWNGGLGAAQMNWLRMSLRDAQAAREPVILVCHFPVFAESSRPDHLLWNWPDVLALIDASPAVVVWINGHDHSGGAASRNGVQYITLPGFVEHGTPQSCFFPRLWNDRLELRDATGATVHRLPLRLPARQPSSG
jgi:manganese-dependent ADP-ribose/CDP-alcohol diphosphatase